jgi:hypothetical protein
MDGISDDLLDTDADELTQLRADLMGQQHAYDLLLDEVEALRPLVDRCTEAESGREYWRLHSEDMLARARQAEAERDKWVEDARLMTQNRDHQREQREQAEAEVARLQSTPRGTARIWAVKYENAAAELTALRERHAELREWLLADGELATITVAAVVAHIEAWARRES